jgi:hypothetical protein
MRAKSSTPIATATKLTRHLIKTVLGTQTGITIKSSTSYDMALKVNTLVTTISYPLGTDYDRLSDALAAGTLSVIAGEYAMTVVRAA